MKMTRFTSTIEVPTANRPAFAAALSDLLSRFDGKTTRSAQFDFSPEFVELELGTQTNIALVANNIETVD
ncbi:MAG TPA: hypothetical protein VMT30_04615 [Candidatus Saccharimonadia bacterium]|nr:hypothetical protein [Candidatus Saccharimonadia bacterium]